MDILSIYFVVSVIAVLMAIWNTYVANTHDRVIIPRVSLNDMVFAMICCFVPFLNIAIIYLKLKEILVVKTFDFDKIYPFEKNS